MSISENNFPNGDIQWLNLLGIGLGPFNLSLAALLSEASYQNFSFFEAKRNFNWHPGMMINEATLQVPFLADLVSLIAPQSKYSFLNYLKEHDRIFSFYFLEKNNIPRKEYNHYCQWVCNDLQTKKNVINFSSTVKNIEKVVGGFKVYINQDTKTQIYYTKNIVIGIGTSPHIPNCLTKLQMIYPDKILHSSDFLNHDLDLDTQKVTVLGSGQSSAEIILQLLKSRNNCDNPNKLYWMTRSKSFQPMENSKLGLELFSPQYVKYFYNLTSENKNKLLNTQGFLYKGISINTISDIFTTIYNQTIECGQSPLNMVCASELIDVEARENDFTLTFLEKNENKKYKITSNIIIAGTGYKNTEKPFLSNLSDSISKDEFERYKVNDSYEIDYSGTGSIFIQNGEMHSHGVGSPDLGLGAWRSAKIVNKLLGYTHYKLPNQTAFQKFGSSEILSVESI